MSPLETEMLGFTEIFYNSQPIYIIKYRDFGFEPNFSALLQISSVFFSPISCLNEDWHINSLTNSGPTTGSRNCLVTQSISKIPGLFRVSGIGHLYFITIAEYD